MDKSVSDVNEFNKTGDEKQVSYSAPELKVYGTVSALTAAGSTTCVETGNNGHFKSPRC